MLAGQEGAGDPLEVALGAASPNVDRHAHGLNPSGLDRERDLLRWIIEAGPMGVTLETLNLARERGVPGRLAGLSGHGAIPSGACWSVILRHERGRRHGRVAVFPRSSTGREAPPPRPRACGGFLPAPGLPRHPRPSWLACCSGEAGHGGSSHPSRTGDRTAPPSRHTSTPLSRASIGTGADCAIRASSLAPSDRPAHSGRQQNGRRHRPQAAGERFFPAARRAAPCPPRNVLLWLLRSASAPVGCDQRRRPFLESPSRAGRSRAPGR